MKKAFTLIELVVAVALLAMVFAFTGTIFRVSIDSYRTSVANGEIMQKLRAITNQLNSDFEGIRSDAPVLFWFQKNPDPNDPGRRFDQVMFFASGNFQSIQLYDDTPPCRPDPNGNKLLVGNTARIFYGQAQQGSNKDPDEQDAEDRILARRQHILTADDDLYDWPDPNFSVRPRENDYYEHDRLPLALWKIIKKSTYGNRIIPVCFYYRPYVDVDNSRTFHKLLCEGVGSFSIQWAYWDLSNDLKWRPDESDFGGADYFGIYFNIPGTGSIFNWDDNITAGYEFPMALKFTFRLYDSRGIIKEDGIPGREFTHIVYLDD